MLSFYLKKILKNRQCRLMLVILFICLSIMTISGIQAIKNEMDNREVYHQYRIQQLTKQKIDMTDVSESQKKRIETYNQYKDFFIGLHKSILTNDITAYIDNMEAGISLETELMQNISMQIPFEDQQRYLYPIYTDALYIKEWSNRKEKLLALQAEDKTAESVLNLDGQSILLRLLGEYGPISLTAVFICVVFLLFSQSLFDDKKEHRSFINTLPTHPLMYQCKRIVLFSSFLTGVQVFGLGLYTLAISCFVGLGSVFRQYAIQWDKETTLMLPFVSVVGIIIGMLWLLNMIWYLILILIHRLTRSRLLAVAVTGLLLVSEHLLLNSGKKSVLHYFLPSYYTDMLPSINGLKNVLYKSHFSVVFNVQQLVLMAGSLFIVYLLIVWIQERLRFSIKINVWW